MNTLTIGARDYWQIYFDREIVQRSNQLRQEFTILSTGVELHLDVYDRGESTAPVILFNHGAAGYSRMFTHLALQFFDLGYTVVLPDQRGQGLSGGDRGDYTFAECIQNIVDAANWAKDKFGTALFLAGGSLGGGLTYYAAAAGAPVCAIACLNLLDLGTDDALLFSRMAPLTRIPFVSQVLQSSMMLLEPFEQVHIPYGWIGVFEKLMDERDSLFQAQWDADPVPPRTISLRGLRSMSGFPPAVSLEANSIPTLVLNQQFDKMVDPVVTRRNYERLGGAKRYLELPFGHWSSQPEFWSLLVTACDEWFRSYVVEQN
ncbi:alpha/beta hydrolase [Leptolyngbya sp. AN03gr2]|uniref:alpha/beta hydrolase n=1 Tax=unclassified Leptolyngbya TaxID=2650499 RepID=UPI003D31DF61